MNAVEAAEQLIALGKRVQAAERHWQQPVAALQTTGPWEQLLADPLAALATLLAAAGGHVRTPARQSGASQPPTRLRQSNGPTGPLPPAFVAVPAQAEGQPGSAQTAPVPASSAPLPTRAPAQATRLARSQSSLLGILSANVEGSESASATSRGADEQGYGAARTNPTAQSINAGAPGAGSPRSMGQERSGAFGGAGEGLGDTFAPASAAPAAVRSGWDWQAAPPGLSTSGGQDTAAGAGALRPAERAAAPIDGGSDRRPTVTMSGGEAFAVAAGVDANVAAIVAANTPAPDYVALGRSPEGWRATTANLLPGSAAANPTSRLANAQEAAAPDVAVWPAMPDSTERPLSRAQIDQVLAALDERLELLLLRTYGAAGSA